MRRLILSVILSFSIPVLAVDKFQETLQVAVESQDAALAVQSVGELAAYIRDNYRLVEGGAFGPEEMQLTNYEQRLAAYARLSQQLPIEVQRAQFDELTRQLQKELGPQLYANEQENKYAFNHPARGAVSLLAQGALLFLIVAESKGYDIYPPWLTIAVVTPVFFPEIAGLSRWASHQIATRGEKTVTLREAVIQQKTQELLRVALLKKQSWADCEAALTPRRGLLLYR